MTQERRQKVPEDEVTLYGVLAALGVVGLVLVFLVSLGFLLGTLLRRPLLSLVLLAFFWFAFGFILQTFSLEEFSPISLNQALPTLLRQPWRPVEADSQNELSQEESEALEQMAAVRRALSFGFASGGSMGSGDWESRFTGGQPVKKDPGFFQREDFADFSLLRVLLGYGLPSLAAVGLATACFCWRDL